MSYSAITLNKDTHFTWNYPYRDGATIISDINDLTVNNKVTAYMPYGRNIALGTSVMFNNLGPESVTLMDFFGAKEIATLAKGDIVNVYLTQSVDTDAETYDVWRAVQTTGGSIGITNLSISPNDKNTPLIIDGSPVESGQSGTIVIDTNPVLKNFSTLNSTGLLVSTTDDGENIKTRSLVTSNGLIIENPDGGTGNIAINIADNISLSQLTANTINSNGPNSQLTLNGVTIDTNSNVTIPGNLTFKGNFFSPAIMKAWVVFDNVITTTKDIISKLAEMNVASIETSSGYYTINFDKPFIDTNYGVLITLGSAGTPPNISVRHGFVISKQPTNVVIAIVDASGQLVNDVPQGVTVAIISL